MEKTFRKRPGTTNKGGDYEILNIANMSMQLVMDETITDFRISSNDEDFGAFDDIVVEMEMQNGTEIIYAMQLKHNDRANLSSKQLTQAKGDFSLKKYFDSVQTLKIPETKFILFTNLKFNVAEDTKFYLDGENFPIIVTKIQSTFGFKISNKTDHCYKFSILKDGSYEYSSTVLLYERFFENFFLYADQENIHNLERNVTERFKSLFSANDAECDQYVKYLNKWGLQEGKKEKLDKKLIKLIIALNIFSSRIKPLSFNCNNDIENTKIIKRNILREVIVAFDVIMFEKESYDEVKQLWDDGKCELKDIKAANKLRKKYQLVSTHISDVDQIDSLTLSKLLWLLGKCPLILTQDESVEKAVELCAGRKFILLKNDSVNLCKSNVSVFTTLQDLNTKTSLYDRLVRNFTCSLQGKDDISLEHLIKIDEKIESILKTDDLLKMVKGPCGFGSWQRLVTPYIERYVLKNAIDFKLLDNITDETVVILDCVPHNNDLRTRFKSHTLININEGKTLNIENSNDQRSHLEAFGLNTTIYLSEKRCKYDEFNTIYNQIQNSKILHQFRVRDDGNLEWIRTKGDVNDVEKYKLSQCYSFRERDLDSSEFENNINLLISDPGMGKSELMNSFKIKCFPKYFTVIVDPKDVYSFLKNTRDGDNYVDAFQKFVLYKRKSLSDRDKNVFRLFLKTNQIIYVWDALDELSDKHRDIVIDIILELSNDCVHWVTSRRHLQNLLQNKFNVLGLNLNKFNEDEQINYIQERLSDDETTKQEIQMIINKIKSSFALVEHTDILGIPLQLFMLTELFRQDRAKYSELLNNFFLLTDLYKYFIEEKVNILHREKLGIDLNTSSTELLIQNQKLNILEDYTDAALRLLFPDTIFTKKEFFRTIHETHSNIGLVTEIKDQIPHFLHNSFAEYLAARYFVSNIGHLDFQTHDLFDPKYTNVRFFFDLLLTRRSQTHIAILYKNYSFLKSCNRNILTNKDCGGRSVLHLACSWGQSYPELNVKYVGDDYIVDYDGQFDTIPEAEEYLETIDYLLENCDISESDEIYKMSPTEYARKARCRGAEMRTTMKEMILNPKLTEIDHIIKLMHYSAYYGYHDEFEFFSIQVEGTFVKLEDNTRRKFLSSTIAANIKNNAGMTLLYIAAKMGHVKIVEFLFKAGADVNVADINGMTPLCIASQNGYDQIVEFLFMVGADINLANKNGATALFIASQNGNDTIVEFLFKAGTDINLVTEDGWTPLNISSQNGHDKIVEFLLKVGADIHLANKNGATPLYIACQNGNDTIVECLFKAGADINLANKNGATPLYIASQNGQHKIVEYLIKVGANIHLANKDGVTPLYIASQNGNVKIVELLLKAGADINLPTKDGWTALSTSSQNGHDKIVELLCKAGADINLANKNGAMPLYIASKNGNDKIVEFFIKVGTDINLPTKDGWTPLKISSQNGHDKIVELLFKAGADVNLANKNGATSLYIASQNGNYKIVEFLIKAGADVNLPTKDGWTPLNVSSQNGYDKIVELLFKAGADVSLADKSGWTPLNTASEKGNNKIVEFLLKVGAVVNLANKNGATSLNIASQNGHDEIVELLLKVGADINLADKDGRTPLNTASEKENDKIVEFLLKGGADINFANKIGATPLYTASQNGYDKIVELLLKGGADVNLASNSDGTPFYIASQNEHDKIVELLLKSGADVNVADRNDSTALNTASKKGNQKVVECLLKSGADVNLADKNGATPLYIASRDGNDKIVELLVKAGADVNLAQKTDWTPLHIASYKGHREIVFFLVESGADINVINKLGKTPLELALLGEHNDIVTFLKQSGPVKNKKCVIV